VNDVISEVSFWPFWLMLPDLGYNWGPDLGDLGYKKQIN